MEIFFDAAVIFRFMFLAKFSSMKLSELHKSMRAVKFFPLMVTACERRFGQAAVIASSLNIVGILWAYGVVVSMFHFHRSDWGSNPGRDGKIS